ncbi:aconitate hydratase [Actinomyces sp. HMSC06A08]|uniref:Aconitate hydratase n=1 Tax=Winkia neuii TaxID=33007 RepID=A0A2I1IL26_9ACTO|nr:aconitate hydratase AcnA [Winkia neuii]OFJ70147.1 aconitate hydratase [Actinomyces sp. HMSC064C12]OFK04447.1 aconitate hydratase [Actinomyces sp. HMSC072A03]OFT56303.1 aconitate hydratase [Actinomyces sp. HMSC06A08]MDK8099902.1 aconitate hydratase AcnA [Winkia neuii]PKY71836.1 aconitate hydratase AcnA [Winkia neuii]
MKSLDSFQAKQELKVGGKRYQIFSLNSVPGLEKLPFCLKILAENLLRNEDGENVSADQIARLANWQPGAGDKTEVQFTPARVLMQDFTGVPCIVDLATMREAVQELGGDPERINPQVPAEMVIDHSVIIDSFGSSQSFEHNVDAEYERNRERYQFLRWGQGAFANFKVVPPGTGIVHQVNIEYLARGVFTDTVDGQVLAYPDTCVGTDSHTTMVNGLGVLGWGVGGIEAEAAMLGQPVSMLIPPVVGFKLKGAIPPGATATDVVLTITQMLREHGVVGKFVEFYGEGVSSVPLANRATIGNMSPEFGSTAAIFPIDRVTVDYLRITGRSEETVDLVEAYAKAQGLWHDPQRQVQYSEYLELDLATVVPSIAGPKRPQDRIELRRAKQAFKQVLTPTYTATADQPTEIDLGGKKYTLNNGAVAIASITSCTNTSNPSVMVAAGLLAKNAVEAGLTSKPWVKTTMAPGSKVVTDYYREAGLWKYLDALGFNLVGYGCTTCIGNSGPLLPEVSQAVSERDLAVVSVLSGNRNFEGRINPDVKMNYLASPPLVIAYALAGTMDFDFAKDPLGTRPDGTKIFLTDFWPSASQVEKVVATSIDRSMYVSDYADVFSGDERWRNLEVESGKLFSWDPESTYIRKPHFFADMDRQPADVEDIEGARVLLKLGDFVTTDHISPAGQFASSSPAGKYLLSHGLRRTEFNSYGSRRGNHEVMMRGTFANIRIKNQLLDGVEGGFTRDFTRPGGPQESIFEASQHYREAGVPLVILGGREYGSGSSRDWAAKGTLLLGVKAVIAASYERIHRSNLIGMGVLPLQFPSGQTADSLGLTGNERFDITGLEALNRTIPRTVTVTANRGTLKPITFEAIVRIDTPGEAKYYRNGGILPYVLRKLTS